MRKFKMPSAFFILFMIIAQTTSSVNDLFLPFSRLMLTHINALCKRQPIIYGINPELFMTTVSNIILTYHFLTYTCHFLTHSLTKYA